MIRLAGTISMILLFCVPVLGRSQILQLLGPTDLGSARSLINFDENSNYVPANTLYEAAGITFSRDDGGIVPVFDLVYYGFQVPSSNNVLFSGFYPLIGPTQAFTTHITVDSLQPLTEIGAFFGNDSYFPEYGFTRLSLFGMSNNFLGSVDVAVNNNRDIDQFIGIRSGLPFYHARFENFTPEGIVSPGAGVAIDNLMFTAVPEPSTAGLIGLGLACGFYCLRKRRGP